MTNFAHISPTKYLELFGNGRDFHLALAHLVASDIEYVNFYKRMAEQGKTIVMDNSAYELFMQGNEMYPPDKLRDLANSIGATYVVLPDYPQEDYTKTIRVGSEFIQEIKQQGFGTFFVPQSLRGDLRGLIKGFEYAVENPDIDYIGISIIAVPNAYNALDNPLQRFLSRWAFMEELDRRGLITAAKAAKKKIHFLGMLDGPHEIVLVKDYLWAIDSWDSSAAIWSGLNNKIFDNSPTGLAAGKISKPVDFNHKDATLDQLKLAAYNADYIDRLLEEYGGVYRVR